MLDCIKTTVDMNVDIILAIESRVMKFEDPTQIPHEGVLKGWKNFKITFKSFKQLITTKDLQMSNLKNYREYFRKIPTS